MVVLLLMIVGLAVAGYAAMRVMDHRRKAKVEAYLREVQARSDAITLQDDRETFWRERRDRTVIDFRGNGSRKSGARREVRRASANLDVAQPFNPDQTI